MSHEDIISVLLWLVFIGWGGVIILLIGAARDAKTISEFYEYAKQLEKRLAALHGGNHE